VTNGPVPSNRMNPARNNPLTRSGFAKQKHRKPVVAGALDFGKRVPDTNRIADQRVVRVDSRAAGNSHIRHGVVTPEKFLRVLTQIV